MNGRVLPRRVRAADVAVFVAYFASADLIIRYLCWRKRSAAVGRRRTQSDARCCVGVGDCDVRWMSSAAASPTLGSSLVISACVASSFVEPEYDRTATAAVDRSRAKLPTGRLRCVPTVDR